MIGRMYSITIAAQTQSAANTLIVITSGSAVVTMVERAWISQSNFDTSENLSAKIQRASVAGTSTDSTTNVAKYNPSDASISGTIGTNCTVPPTYTSTAILVAQGFNVLSGWLWTPASDDEIVAIAPSAIVGIMLNTAPSTSMAFDYGCTMRQIG